MKKLLLGIAFCFVGTFAHAQWTAEVVDIVSSNTYADIVVVFTDGNRYEKIPYRISDPNSVPLICWRQIEQYEKLDNIQNSKAVMGPVDVTAFRPTSARVPTDADIARDQFVIDYTALKRLKLALSQGLAIDPKTITDLESTVKSEFLIEYLPYIN